MPDDADRALLHGYIAASRRVQKRLALVVAAMAAISIAVMFWDGRIGGLALLGTAIIGGCGFWVTAAHIADWRFKLKRLDQDRSPGANKIRGKRAS